jgi:hypothetical protein
MLSTNVRGGYSRRSGVEFSQKPAKRIPSIAANPTSPGWLVLDKRNRRGLRQTRRLIVVLEPRQLFGEKQWNVQDEVGGCLLPSFRFLFPNLVLAQPAFSKREA